MKDVEVIFDKDAYKEYSILQEYVKNRKKSKKKPTYNQLLESINHAIKNIKLNHNYGNLIPRKYISKQGIRKRPR